MLYDLHNRIKDELLATNQINKVTWGDIFDIDLERKNDYALAHIIYQSANVNGAYNTFQIDIIFADMVTDSANNRMDVLNNLLIVATRIAKSFDGGELYDFGYRIDPNPNLEPFNERFEMNLSGWTLSMTINVPNDISRCN